MAQLRRATARPQSEIKGDVFENLGSTINRVPRLSVLFLSANNKKSIEQQRGWGGGRGWVEAMRSEMEGDGGSSVEWVASRQRSSVRVEALEKRRRFPSAVGGGGMRPAAAAAGVKFSAG